MPQATIQIRTSFRFYQPAFRGCKTAISIDGGEEELRAWGSTDHPVEAGQHTVHVEVLYALNKRGGKGHPDGGCRPG